MYKFEHIHLLSTVHLLFCFVVCKDNDGGSWSLCNKIFRVVMINIYKHKISKISDVPKRLVSFMSYEVLPKLETKCFVYHKNHTCIIAFERREKLCIGL